MHVGVCAPATAVQAWKSVNTTCMCVYRVFIVDDGKNAGPETRLCSSLLQRETSLTEFALVRHKDFIVFIRPQALIGLLSTGTSMATLTKCTEL